MSFADSERLGRAIGQRLEGSSLHDPPVGWLSWGRGRPNYMPEWEMIQVDGEWYHIGGASLGADIEFSPDEEFKSETRLVPYSLAPSLLSRPTGGNSSPSPSGLIHYRELFRKCLGNLYSVPPDYRICFAFEKDVLHAAVRDGLPLNDALNKLRRIWEMLYECGGSFEITDVDDFRQMTWYGWKDIDENSLQEEEGDPRTLAGPALSAEEFKVSILPVRCELNKRAGAPAVVRRVGATHWYRIISFRGLAAILKSKAVKSDIDIDQFCNLVFREVDDPCTDPWFRSVPIQRLKDLLDVHVRCKGRSEDDNPFEGNWAPFHITWFKISPNGQQPLYGNWKSGALYGTTKRSGAACYLQEMAFTMSIFRSRLGDWRVSYMDEPPVRGAANDSPDPGLWYWSIVHLAPAHFYPLHQENAWPEFCYDGHTIPVALIIQALREAADSWEQIANHLGSLIDNQGAIFDPHEHDRLLFDDNTFSRSRLYFWAIDCLGIFIPSISATMREWRNFWEARKHLFNASENVIKEVRRRTEYGEPPWAYEGYNLANLLPDVEAQIARLEGIKARLEDMRAQIDTLRNGVSTHVLPTLPQRALT